MRYSSKELLQMDPLEVYKLLLSDKITRFPVGFLKRDEESRLNIGIKLFKYLIEEKLKWSDDEICENLSSNTFYDYKLGSIFHNIFKGSPYMALNYLYPDKFKQWQLSSVSKKFWNEKTGVESTIWLFEKKLKWSDTKICKDISIKLFYDNGLGGMLITVFKGSPYIALSHAYPGKFEPCKFNSKSNVIGIKLREEYVNKLSA